MKKLRKKQVPACVALGLVTVGMLGYTAKSVFLRPARAVVPPPGGGSASEPYGPGTGPLGAAPGGAAGGPKMFAQLQTIPPSFTTDPFRPAVGEGGGRRLDPGAAGAKIGKALGSVFASLASNLTPEKVSFNNAPSLPPGGEWTPASLRDEFGDRAAGREGPTAGTPGSVPGYSGQPGGGQPGGAASPMEARPTLVLTGVIEGDPSVAILRGGQDERQVVRVNDRVAGRYVVKAIHADGILLAATGGSRPDRWFLPLGEKAAGSGSGSSSSAGSVPSSSGAVVKPASSPGTIQSHGFTLPPALASQQE